MYAHRASSYKFVVDFFFPGGEGGGGGGGEGGQLYINRAIYRSDYIANSVFAFKL